MLPPFQLDQAVNRLVREEWGRILAALLASTGNLQLAEDALQDAIEVALVKWNEHGLPSEPAAWLLTTARRKAIDHYRRQSTLMKVQPAIAYELEMEAAESQDRAGELVDVVIPDKRLELIFTCCHPALDWKTRVALTLRTLGGLTTEEIARAFLDKPGTMAQRLVRARNKIAVAGIGFELPDKSCLSERLDGVLSVIYFIFNEGYAATGNSHELRSSLGDEAVRLGRVMHVLLPDKAEVTGLLALMLLHDSRRAARLSNKGGFISLEQQDRSLWDRPKISEGLSLLTSAMDLRAPGPYQIQAAISALHAQAPDWNSTDWNQIVALYEGLYVFLPSPVIKVNHAVALSFAQTPLVALEVLETLQCDPSIMQYQPYYVAHADLMFRAGQIDKAIKYLSQAIALSESEADREHLRKRLNEMRAGTS
ncbi:MAG: RNA polymerase sigma factor [Granulosicoccus sp.]